MRESLLSIDVYLASLDVDVDDRARYYDILDDRERARVERLRQPIDKDHYIVSHGMLREILAHHTGEQAASITFRYGQFGKPYIGEPGPDRLQFNMSDSSGMLLVAVARGVEVGVDIERRRPMEYLKFARRFFTHAEASSLEALHDIDREPAFFRLWTAKEAYVKGWGYGIQRNVGKFEVRLTGARRELARCSFDETAPGRWSLVGIPGIDGYEATVAVERAGVDELSIRSWPAR